MAYTFLIALILLFPPENVSDDNRLISQVRSQISDIENRQQAQDRQYNGEWFLQRHKQCEQMNRRSYEQQLNCRRGIERQYTTLQRDRSSNNEQIRHLRTREVALQRTIELTRQIESLSTGSDSGKREAMRLHAQRAETYIERSRWSGWANSGNDRAAAVDDYGLAAEYAADLGDFDAMTRYIELQSQYDE
ncbi:MAG: hypothetical protein LAT80_11770 [Balneolaceae bacterium]|nr:hypothetical protein [Balneolaceae bacterium]